MFKHNDQTVCNYVCDLASQSLPPNCTSQKKQHHHNNVHTAQVMEEPAQGGEPAVSSSTSSSVVVQVMQDHYSNFHVTVFINNTQHHERPQAAEPALAQAPPPVHGLPSLKQVGWS